jgi:hypothetical protein
LLSCGFGEKSKKNPFEVEKNEKEHPGKIEDLPRKEDTTI